MGRLVVTGRGVEAPARLRGEETTVVPSGLSFWGVVLWMVFAIPLPGEGRGGDPQRLREGQSKMLWSPPQASPRGPMRLQMCLSFFGQFASLWLQPFLLLHM